MRHKWKSDNPKHTIVWDSSKTLTYSYTYNKVSGKFIEFKVIKGNDK